MLKIRSPVITRVLFWCLQFSLQDELHTGLIKAGASVGCGNHVLYVKLMTLLRIRLSGTNSCGKYYIILDKVDEAAIRADFSGEWD